jgi:hypothetical protein
MFRASRTGTAAIALLVLSQPLSALTAQDAWEGWKSMASGYGQDVTTDSEVYSGADLTVSGAQFTLQEPGEDVTIRYTIPEIRFEGQGDGVVRITLSDRYDIEVTGEGEDGAPVAGVLTLSHPGLSVLASDAADGARYVYSAPEVTITAGTFTEAGELIDLEMGATLAALSGAYQMAGDEVTATFSAGPIAMALAATDSDTGAVVSGTVAVESLAVTSDSRNGTLMGAADMGAMLRNGFATDARFVYGASDFDFSFAEEGESGRIFGRTEGGTAQLSLDRAQLDYDVTYDGFRMSVSGSDIPLPQVDMAFGELQTRLVMPMQPTEAAEPFALTAALRDVTLGDGVWNLFDPAGILPRDPATLVVDLVGAGRWLVDITDPMMADVEEPGEVTRLDLREVVLRIAGAELVATGGFGFDYGDRERFDGMPRPEGSVSMVLTGANALLDRLVQMGLLQPEDAMSARMMSGMLLRPGDGVDVLVSEIAVSPSGQVTANGVPLPF